MKNRISTWFGLMLASLLVACSNTQVPKPPAVTSTLIVAPTPTVAPVATETRQPTSLPAEFVWKIAGNPNPLNKPVGIAIDPQGNIFVMDAGNSRVQKFNSDGKFLSTWGSPGSGDGQFSITLPDEGRLAVDSQGNVYVLDVSNFRIQKFDSNGNYLTQWGTRGSEDGQFGEPSDIAIDKQNNIYIVDYRNRVVQKFDENGKFLLRWGSTANTPFAGLYSVAIDPDGNVLVTDEAGQLQRFDGNGNFLSKIPLAKPDTLKIDTWNIAVDTQGDIYVADHGGNRIVKLNGRGEILASWRGKETGAEMFNSLQDIALDEQGNVFVSDSGSNLIQKFRQLTSQP